MSSIAISGNLPGGVTDARTPYHRRRTGSSRRQPQRVGKDDAARADVLSFGRFLTTPIRPVVKTDEKHRLDITDTNYRRLYKAAGMFASHFGYKALPFPESSDPADGTIILYSFLRELSGHMQVFLDDNDDTPSSERVSFVDMAVITDGCLGYYLPLCGTYERMSPEFGLLVRRFIKALAIGSGIDDFDCSAADLIQDWIEDMADDCNEEDAKVAATYYGNRPGTVGEKLTDYRKNIVPLTEEELLSYKPANKAEEELYECLVNGAGWLRQENWFDILSYAEFEMNSEWSDEFCDCYIPICYYFDVVWDADDDNPMMRFIEMAVNDSFNSGAAGQGLVLFHDISDGEKTASVENLPVTKFLNYMVDLRIHLDRFPSAYNI